MGKQRTPQGQRPGRRMPVRSVLAGAAGPTAAEARPEVTMDAESEANQAAPAQDIPSVEVLEADSTTSEAAPMTEAAPEMADAAGEPAFATAADETHAEPETVAEAVAASPDEPVALDAQPSEIIDEGPAVQAAADEERAETPASEAVLADPLLPVATLAALEPAAAAHPDRPAHAHAAFRFAFAPARIDVEGIGVVLANYVHNESVAAFSHMRALSTARSAAEMIRLNVSEMQRAADASLTCWSDIARRAARSVPLH